MAVKIPASAFTKSFAQKYKLVPHIEKALGQGEFVWDFKYEPKRTDTAWHPSGDCTPSLTDLYLKATGEYATRPISGSLYKTFMVGHFWHQYLQWVIEKNLEFCDASAIERRGMKVWAEAPMGPTIRTAVVLPEPYHWVTGSGDIAPCSIPGHGDYLVDFKTMNARDFSRPDPPPYYADKWECQMNIYMDFFDLERAIVLGVDKDSPHAFKEFEYRRNQNLIDVLYMKWKLVSECVDNEVTIPEGEEIHLPLKGHVSE